jgi:hypothetical protein
MESGWLSAILSGLFQGFLGLFGMSAQQRLGRLQIQDEGKDSLIKGLEAKDAINKASDHLSAADIDRRLRDNFRRPR